jgi:hypothetical protein
MFGKKIVISVPLLYRRPLFRRQLKNNQNQTNTTGAQNLKEFNNTAGSNCVTFLAFLTTYFDEHFSGKRYFNDILWASAYNNNTLPIEQIHLMVVKK